MERENDALGVDEKVRDWIEARRAQIAADEDPTNAFLNMHADIAAEAALAHFTGLGGIARPKVKGVSAGIAAGTNQLRPVKGGIGAQYSTPKGFTTYTDIDGSIVHVSPSGLKYGPDPKFGNRVDHVLAHTAPDASKPKHSQFNVSGDDALSLVDEAWSKRGASVAGDSRAFVVDMGQVVGTKGETSIKIIADPQTGYITTAFPWSP